jgi:hypothetical protein
MELFRLSIALENILEKTGPNRNPFNLLTNPNLQPCTDSLAAPRSSSPLRPPSLHVAPAHGRHAFPAVAQVRGRRASPAVAPVHGCLRLPCHHAGPWPPPESTFRTIYPLPTAPPCHDQANSGRRITHITEQEVRKQKIQMRGEVVLAPMTARVLLYIIRNGDRSYNRVALALYRS